MLRELAPEARASQDAESRNLGPVSITIPVQLGQITWKSRTEPRRLLLVKAELFWPSELRDGDGREAAGDSEAQGEEVHAEARAHLHQQTFISENELFCKILDKVWC